MLNQGQQLQNVPNGVAQQARQQQDQRQQGFGKYTPSDNGLASLLSSDPADVTFDFDQASGEFQLRNRQQQPANQQQLSNQPNNGQQAVNPQPNNSNNNGADMYKDKFAAIEQKFTDFTQALTRMAAYMEALGNASQQQNQQSQGQQQQQIALDIQSEDFGTNLLNIINSALDRRDAKLREEFAPLRQTTDQMNDRLKGSDLAMQYPEEFTKLMPVMQELKKSDPSKSWEKVFTEAKNLAPFLKDSTIRTDNGSQQQAPVTQPQSDQNQLLQQRANQLQTETGGIPHGMVNQEPPINSIADAVNKSFRDLGIG